MSCENEITLNVKSVEIDSYTCSVNYVVVNEYPDAVRLYCVTDTCEITDGLTQLIDAPKELDLNKVYIMSTYRVQVTERGYKSAISHGTQFTTDSENKEVFVNFTNN